MPIQLEYIICQVQTGRESRAILSHRQRYQNPGLDVSFVGRSHVEWNLTGLREGIREDIPEDDPRANHIDFYIGYGELAEQFREFPLPRVAPDRGHVPVTNPLPAIRRGGTRIPWRGAINRIPIQRAEAIFPGMRVAVGGNLSINLDREFAQYPLVDGTRREIHFGVAGEYGARADRRMAHPRVQLVMDRRQYATVLYTLFGVLVLGL